MQAFGPAHFLFERSFSCRQHKKHTPSCNLHNGVLFIGKVWSGKRKRRQSLRSSVIFLGGSWWILKPRPKNAPLGHFCPAGRNRGARAVRIHQRNSGKIEKYKKRDTSFEVSRFWWELVDSNNFAPLLSAKILTSAAKKIPYPCTFYWMGDFNLRGVNQKCGQKCGQTAPRPELFCSLTAPHQSVILGYLSDATKSSRPKNTSL